MNKLAKLLFCLVACSAALVSCEETDNTFDSYHNWQARNAAYFLNAADSARSAISAAKATYGDNWEAHCDWRMYRSTAQDADTDLGRVTDSICVRIVERGTGSGSPIWTDTVRTNYRGTLMPYETLVNGEITVTTRAFDQSYYGEFDPAVAIPTKFQVGNLVAGMATAFQYMHIGDRWVVYIPEQLGYGSSTITGSNGVPSYSTLVFDFDLVAYYREGVTVPDWQ